MYEIYNINLYYLFFKEAFSFKAYKESENEWENVFFNFFFYEPE